MSAKTIPYAVWAAIGLSMALIIGALSAMPAYADGWKNRIVVTSGAKSQTYTGPNALPQAIGALPQGASTMTLQGDCEYDSYQTTTMTIPSGKRVTLVLNGFDLDAEGAALAVQGELTITNGDGSGAGAGEVAFEPWGPAPSIVVTGALTLQSGGISGDNGPALQTRGSGSFTMNGGTVESDVRGGAVIVASGGNVTMTGGAVENGAHQGEIVSADGGIVLVSGGAFEPTPIPAAMLDPSVCQVGGRIGDDNEYFVGTSENVVTALNRLYRGGAVSVLNGTFDITTSLNRGITVTATAPGVLQVNGEVVSSYSGTGKPPISGADTPSPGPNPPTYGAIEPIWRLYNPNSHGRFYVDDYEKAQTLVWLGWLNEGIGWNAPEDGEDVYQLYNPNNGDHYWTMDRKEYRELQRLGWRGEGDAWESAPASSGVPIYQLYNPYETVNTHLWTSDTVEVSALVSIGWINEGPKWYAASLPR